MERQSPISTPLVHVFIKNAQVLCGYLLMLFVQFLWPFKSLVMAMAPSYWMELNAEVMRIIFSNVLTVGLEYMAVATLKMLV